MPNAGRRGKSSKCESLPLNARELAALSLLRRRGEGLGEYERERSRGTGEAGGVTKNVLFCTVVGLI